MFRTYLTDIQPLRLTGLAFGSGALLIDEIEDQITGTTLTQPFSLASAKISTMSQVKENKLSI